ncbi:MAG: hypothetical protein NVS3B19_10440 [Ginsengibacter sp.]
MILMKHIKTALVTTTQFALIFLLHGSAFAQKDTVRKQTIDITSSYKPVLRNFSKINLTPSAFTGDTGSIKLTYTVPAMNLFYVYQPVPLKPLALQTDSTIPAGLKNSIKAGYGNFNSPLLQAVIGFGDIKHTLITGTADYISSKGHLDFQDFHHLNAMIAGSYLSSDNEWYGGIGVTNDQYYQYGFDHNIAHNYSEDAISRNYTNLALNVGFKSTSKHGTSLTYNPTLVFNSFKIRKNSNENNVTAALPFCLKASDQFVYLFTIKNDYSNYSCGQSNSVVTNNNIFQIKAKAEYKNEKYFVSGGLAPTFEKGKVSLLPEAEFITRVQTNSLIRLGIAADIYKNTLKSLTTYNPFINDPAQLTNTKKTEIYAGFKSTLGHHLDVNVTAGVIRYTNMALYINDTLNDKGFNVVYEPKLNDVSLRVEIKYYSQEKFTILSKWEINTYSGLRDNRNAWGLIPVSFKTEAFWFGLPNITLNGDINYLSGISAITKGGGEKKQAAAADFSFGADYKIKKGLSIFLDLDNVLNNKYQRWNSYPVYGLQVFGGIKYQF